MAILVDTNLVSPEERVGYWRNALERLFEAQVRIDPRPHPGFHARLAIHRIDRVSLLEGTGAPMAFSTGASPAAAEIVALAAPGGCVTVRQDGRECILSAREICLYSSRLPLELDLTAPAQIVAMSVPEQEFIDLFPQGRQALLKTIPGDSGAPALFVDHANALVRRRDSLDPASARAIADSIIHLLGAVACFAVVDNPYCAHRTREKIERVLRFARANLRDPELGVDVIARAVHLSPRQVHRLFASEPMSLMQWVLAQRLENCRRELAQRHETRRSISEIAYEWGFSDQAHFSRAFRKRFGRSPSEIRQGEPASSGSAPDAAALPDDYDLPQCRGCRFRSTKTSR